MDNYHEKEFSIGDLIKLEISRNDFDDLGSILQLNYTHSIKTNHIITMSFYNDNYTQINQKSLLLLCNHDNILFDNVLMLISINFNNSTSSYAIKLLNKEIAYMKLYVHASTITINKKSKEKEELSFSQLFDLRNLSTLDAKSFTEMLKQGHNTLNESESSNDNLAFIISELDKVNQSLIFEKEKVEQSKKAIKEKELKINQMITRFKEEMMLFADKCYGECHNEIREKMSVLQKKMSLIEANIKNKYSIMKKKYQAETNTPSTTLYEKNTKNNHKDKVANLEIKISFLEDYNESLKSKLQDKENEIAQNNVNEAKQNKMIKKLKDELVLLQSQLKEKKEKASNIISLNNQSNKNPSQISKVIKSKQLISVELNKMQLEYYNNLLIVSEFVSNNKSTSQSIISEKEIKIISLLLMHLMINPINVCNKFPFCCSLILHKILSLVFATDKQIISQFQDYLTDFSNKFPEFKSIVTSSQNINNVMPKEEAALIFISFKINEVDVNCNEILLTKAKSFNGYFNKNKEKYIEKNNTAMFKYILICNVLFSLIIVGDQNEAIKIARDIYQEYICKKDHCAIQFLIQKRYFELLLFINNTTSNCESLMLLLIDSMLIIISLGYTILSETINKSLFNNQNKLMMKKLMLSNGYSDKIIILLFLISFEYPLMRNYLNEFKNELDSINHHRIQSKLINMNIEILNKYIR